jgi:hypothetical protein
MRVESLELIAKYLYKKGIRAKDDLAIRERYDGFFTVQEVDTICGHLAAIEEKQKVLMDK